MNFKTIKTAVAKQFAAMSNQQLFRMNINKDVLWQTYLSAFPEGTNPIYKERTEHDCNCCKQFVRAVGDVVTIKDSVLVSIWDGKVGDANYQIVADALATYVKSVAVKDVFLHYEATAGTNKSFHSLVDGKVGEWDHFFVNIPAKFVKKNADIASALSVVRSTHDVFLRALKEIDQEAIDTVLDLISQNSIYRGEEHKFVVTEFSKLKKQIKKLSDEELDLFVWERVSTLAGSITNIRNSVIGSLLVDLSDGKDIESAVKSFEAKVAPTNYKRPTALVTKKMIDAARTTIEELGLTSALERRYASINDITVNNILFANRDARQKINSDIFDELSANVKQSKKQFDKVEEVNIEKFIADILPRAESIEVMMENSHISNLVSLIAPVDPSAKQMFKWNNSFSWSYSGDMADSDLRQRVAARGGRVDGVFRFSHTWNYDKRNASLMDLHVFMPGNNIEPTNGIDDNYGTGERVGWNNRKHHTSGGVQDVDYTDAAPDGYVPVENITFPILSKMPEGRYICKIHNWCLRQPTKGGFKAEIEFGGTVYQYEVERPLKNKEWVTVAEVMLKNGVFTIKHHLPETTSSKKVWGINTQTFQKVNVIKNSPNHWDDQGVGNKHYFFMIDGCANDGQARGFYNEFLREDMNKHRKVLEIVGNKMRTEETGNQLSGLGFSSTQRNSILCKVGGSVSRVVKIIF